MRTGTLALIRRWWKYIVLCLFVSVVLALILEWLQVNSQPMFNGIRDSLHFKRMLKVAAFLFVFLIILNKIHMWTRIRKIFRDAGTNLLKDKKDTLIHAAVFAGAAVVSYLLLRVYVPYVLSKDINWISNIFIITVSVAVGCLFCFCKILAQKAEIFFLVFSLLIGGNIAFFAADTSHVCWDDEYHYQESVSFSYLGEVRYTGVEEAVMAYDPEQRYEIANLNEWHTGQNEVYKRGAVEIVPRHINLKNYWSAFSGVGIYLGRVLGFPFHLMWEIGRFTGLLAYSIIGYFAIRRLKSGKMILASVLMIPENLFLASSYSYDSGVTVFIALGLAYLFAEWQEPEKKLTWFNTGIIIGALFIGCYTKAIYFPLLLFPLFLPKSKFSSSRQCSCFMCLTIGAMLLLILSFVLPFIGSYATAGDKRGGGDVSASGQIAFIMSDPLAYIRILTDFLKSYLHPDKASDFLTFFAFEGKAPNSSIYLIVLAIAAFTDKSLCDDHFAQRGWTRALFMFVILGIICLVATSMYVMFTSVGLGTINGCQSRYMLPLFFPAIMILGLKGMNNKTNRTVYNGIIFSLAGYVGFTSVLYQIINLYY